jgi:hypothetical protein
MKLFRSFLALCMLACLAWLGGCASMSESECKTANWSQVGFNDGANGVRPSRIAEYTEDCGKIGIKPDPNAYRAAWDQGIQRYCTPQRGWADGQQGLREKSGVCRGLPLEMHFEQALAMGLQVWDTRQRMSSVESQARTAERELAKETDERKRAAIRSRLRQLDFDMSRLRSTLATQQMWQPPALVAPIR